MILTLFKTKAALIATTVLLLTAAPAHAENHTNTHMGHYAVTNDGVNPVNDIYAPAMKTMHEKMMIKPTGDADKDFILGMIPHHQGAIDMAKIVLEKGKDPEVRKLAEDIIEAQETEITFMQDWLKAQEAAAKETNKVKK